MTVRTRLILGFAAVATLLLLPGLFAAARLAELRDLAVQGRGRQAAAALAVGRIQAGLAELDRYERSYVAVRDTLLWRSAEDVKARIRLEMDSLRSSPYARAAASLDGVLDTLMATTDVVHALMKGQQITLATAAFAPLGPLLEESDRLLRALADSVDRLAQEDFRRAESISATARRSTLVAVFFFLVVAVVFAGWTTRALTRPLRRLAAATTAVAAGHLEAPDDLPYDQKDEVGVLSDAFRRMTRRLAELDRMKAEFVGVASHELKTPINVINGYAELIEEEVAGELTDHQHQILDGIVEQARLMSRLVSRLMDISRLEAGSYRMEFEPIHVEDLLTGLLRSFDVLSKRAGVTLSTDVRSTAPEVVVLDVDIIRDEVLGNLVSNSLRHTPEGGWVRVEVWGQSDEIVFQVSDSGTGIPEEHRPFIFEKYYQAERSRAVGSGLGLAIAREMVDAHGGRITLETGPAGVGAIFRVTLPREAPGAD